MVAPKTKRPAPKPKKATKPVAKSKRAAKPAAKPASGVSAEAKALLARDAADALQALRGTFADILEIFRSRVDGRLAGLAEAYRTGCADGTPSPVNHSKGVLAAVKTLKVKPRKGRGKDLQRLEALADRLWEAFPPER